MNISVAPEDVCREVYAPVFHPSMFCAGGGPDRKDSCRVRAGGEGERGEAGEGTGERGSRGGERGSRGGEGGEGKQGWEKGNRGGGRGQAGEEGGEGKQGRGGGTMEKGGRQRPTGHVGRNRHAETDGETEGYRPESKEKQRKRE